jgi:hypothetical protein
MNSRSQIFGQNSQVAISGRIKSYNCKLSIRKPDTVQKGRLNKSANGCTDQFRSGRAGSIVMQP